MVYSLEVEKVDMKRYCMRFTKESIPENWKEATLQSSPKGIFGGLLELQKKYCFLCPAGDVFSRSILQRLIEVLVVVFKNQQRNYSKISHLLIINYNYSNHGGEFRIINCGKHLTVLTMLLPKNLPPLWNSYIYPNYLRWILRLCKAWPGFIEKFKGKNDPKWRTYWVNS